MSDVDQHQTLGHSHERTEPTSGAIAALENIVTALHAQRAAAVGANALRTLDELATVRFGRRERWWLLMLSGGWRKVVPSGNRAADESAQRARRKLEKLGLVSFRWQGMQCGYALLPLGEKVLAAYRCELETGKRIRWPR